MRYLVLLLLAACGPTSLYLRGPKGPTRQCSLPVPIGISHNVPEKYRPAILKAQKFWNEALGSKVFFDMGVVPYAPDDLEAGGLFVVGYPNNYKSATEENVARAFIRQNYHSCITGGFVSIIKPLEEQDAEMIDLAFKHELGHLLGLADIGVDGYLMSGRITRKNRPTSLSAEELEALKLFY